MKNRDYWTCENCGANLDYGEKCDCKENTPPTSAIYTPKRHKRTFYTLKAQNGYISLKKGK